MPRRIHIIGSGSVGKFIGHAIRGVINPPPLTLLLHRPGVLKDFEKANNSLTLNTGKISVVRSGFDAELALPVRDGLRQGHTTPTNQEPFASRISNDIIHNLIVTTKATQVVSAISSIQHRLRPTSTILFLQNGMGIHDKVSETIFPEPTTRPNYMLGTTSHGLNSPTTFTVQHAGYGITNISLLPRFPHGFHPDTSNTPIAAPSVFWGASSRYLLRTLTRIPLLAAVALNPTEFLQAQLEKLAVNCLINPLTVLLDARNGEILHNHHLSRVRYLLLAEISAVIRSLPELRGIPNVDLRFSPERLEGVAVGVARKTSDNISSMLQDVRRAQRTEVEYINGYIVKRGEEVGIKAVMNYMVMQMVIGKQQMVGKEIDNYAPFDYRST